MFVELELKLSTGADFSEDALLAAVESVAEVEPQGTRVMRDAYMDTPGRALARAGLSGRYRQVGRARSLQVKPVLLVPGVVLRRVELSRALASGDDERAALATMLAEELDYPVAEPLRPEVEIHSQRDRFRVTVPGRCVAEMSLDNSSALNPGADRGVPFGELELELQEGDEAAFSEVVERICRVPGLSPSGESKHRRALGLLGGEAYRPLLPMPPFGLLTPADTVARIVCRTHWSNVRRLEPGTRLGLDLEYLHKMRVSTRRLRSAMRSFSPCFDPDVQQEMQAELRWLAAELGLVRDLDVQQFQLPERRAALGPEPEVGWQALTDELQRRWKRARAGLLQALDSDRYQRLCQRAPEVFAPAPQRAAVHPTRRPVAWLAETMIGKRVRQVLKAERKFRKEPLTDRVHALRIRGKQLRYTCEAFAPIYDPKFKRKIKQLAGFQDVLGLFNDSVVSGQQARQLRDEAADGAPREFFFVLGQLDAASRLEADAAEARVADAFEGVGGAAAVKALSGRAAEGVEQADRLSYPRGGA